MTACWKTNIFCLSQSRRARREIQDIKNSPLCELCASNDPDEKWGSGREKVFRFVFGKTLAGQGEKA